MSQAQSRSKSHPAPGARRTAEGVLATRAGLLRIRWSPAGVGSLRFARPGDAPGATPVPAWIARPLRAYLAGRPSGLARIPLDLEGTPFQRRAWAALRRVPAGRTVSYGALAARLGVPRGARAVGRAAASNPVALLVPCHRLVGGRGALTGFRWGIERKRALLALEARSGRKDAHGTSGPGTTRRGRHGMRGSGAHAR